MLATTAILVLATTGTASAASVRIEQRVDVRNLPAGKTLRYDAAPGETNRVLVERLADRRFRVVDDGAVIQAPSECERRSDHEVVCAADGVGVRTGDGDDEGRIPFGQLSGGEGSDVLTGGPFVDLIDGGPGSDVVAGLQGNDLLDGGAGSDVIQGMEGADALRDGESDAAGLAADRIDGGSGWDGLLYQGRAAGVAVDLVSGLGPDGDVVSGVESVSASADGSRLAGDAGANSLSVSGGRNTLDGRAGDDVLVADGVLRDQLSGGPGDDTLRLYFDGAFDAPDETDALSCGPGDDAVFFPSQRQFVPRDCERVFSDEDTPPSGASYRLHPRLHDLGAPIATVSYGFCDDPPGRRACPVHWVARAGGRRIADRTQRLRVNRRGPTVALRLSPEGQRLLRRRRVLRIEVGELLRGRVIDGFRTELRAP